MDRIFKNRNKAPQSEKQEDGGPYEYIDFDHSPEVNEQRPIHPDHEIYLIEDYSNIGFWIMNYHPNFFLGTSKATCRFTIWFI